MADNAVGAVAPVPDHWLDRSDRSDGIAFELLAAPDGLITGDLSEQRHFPRLLAPPCRPVSARMEGQTPDEPPSAWFAADILDLSQGGLSLLIMGTHVLELGQPLTIDFMAHRLPEASATSRFLRARLRWFVNAGPITTLGVSFEEPLLELPELCSDLRQPG